ncbi:MAG: DUF1566 domain-containing protein [Mizugakiibacter sp.]|uniref:Lcl C-terminal domain-containing protein n=1 Tax=Mizugakiibacter sp. TaxID=1972610 RepID=UPI00320C037C
MNALSIRITDHRAGTDHTFQFTPAPGPNIAILSRFIDNGDGTVTDTTTGLMWSKGTVGDASICWNDADTACRELTLAGHRDWRLPTRAELLSLVDDTRHDPAIDSSIFECHPSWYWTSTPTAWASSCAWLVSFSYGLAYFNPRNGLAFVRAVRAAPAGQ